MKKSLLLTMLAAVLLLGCGDKKSATPVAAPKVLHLYNWNNYIASETVTRFEAQCQCQVIQDYYGDNEELLAKLAAGAKGYDIFVPTGNALQALIKQQAVQPLDKTQLTKLSNINPVYLQTQFDPKNEYSVPYAYTTTIIGYNSAKIQELGLPSDSWRLIFDPVILAKIKGKVTVLDSQRELMAAALKYLGYSANDVDAAHWEQAKQTILKAKPYWAAFNNTYVKELALGNIWVAHGYSSDMYQANLDAIAAKRPFNILASIPKEGATLSLDSMVIAKDAPRPDLAHQFIQFMLEGSNAAELSNMVGTGNPNQAALAYIKPEIAKMPVIFPDAEAQKRLEMLVDLPREQRQKLGELYSQIKLQ